MESIRNIISSVASRLGVYGSVGRTGLLFENPEDIEALPRHELFAGGGRGRDWRGHCPPFRYQGSSMWCTAFAGAAMASIFEREERGGITEFSPLELFYRSNGQLYGNYLVNVLNAMKEYVVLEADVKTPVPSSWGPSVFDEWKRKSKATDEAIAFGRQFAIKEAASVRTDNASLASALSVSPLMVAVGVGRGYFNDPAPRQTSYSAYHAVVLVHMDPDGTKHIFDSLTQKQGFSGHHRLAPDYEILAAFSAIDLPNDWRGVQEKAREHSYGSALSHYGKPRRLELEQLAAANLSDAARKNPTLSAMLGRQWTVCTNAVAYGGYSVQDILNHFTSIRRGKGPIFDLDVPRKK